MQAHRLPLGSIRPATPLFFLAGVLLCLAFLSIPLAAQRPSPRDLSLEEALRRAIRTSEAVALARAGVRAAEGEKVAARAERLPQLNGAFSYSRTLISQFSGLGGGAGGGGAAPPDSSLLPPLCNTFRPDSSLPLPERVRTLEDALGCLPTAAGGPGFDFGEIGLGAKNAYSLGLSLAQPIYSGGRIEAQNVLADAIVRNAEFEVRAQNAQLVLDVTQAYYDALLSARLLEITEKSLAQAEATLRFAELAFQVGDQAEYDVLRARVARNNQRNQVVQRRSARDLAFFRLKQLLDLPIEDEVRLTTSLNSAMEAVLPLPPGVESAPDTTVARRIAVRQAEAAIEMQEAQVDLARAQGRPNLSLGSDYGLFAFPQQVVPWPDQFRPNWTIGLQLNVPLFTGGRVRGRVLQAEGGLEQSHFRLEQTRESVALDTRTRLEALETARSALAAIEGTVAEAERAYEIAQLRYEEGVANLTEVGDARLALSQARVDEAQARRDLVIAQVALLLIRDLPLGVGPPTGGALPASAATVGTAVAPADISQPSRGQPVGPTPTLPIPGTPGGAIR